MDEKLIDRKIVVWGTGNVADKFIKKYPQLQLYCFVDNNKERVGEKFYNYEIMSPEILVNNAAQYFIIIASSYHAEISRQINEYGYFETKDYILFQDIDESLVDFEENLRKNIVSLKDRNFKNKVLLFFCLQEYDAREKNLAVFFKKLNDCIGGNLLFMQEATWLSEDEVETFLDIPFWILPKIMGKDRPVQKSHMFIQDGRLLHQDYTSINISKIKEIDSDIELRLLAYHLRLQYPKMAEGFEYYMVDLIIQYMSELICCIRPETVILWNEFHSVHSLIKYICRKNDVPVKYIEFGNLPGTIQFDMKGQMGESWVACNSYDTREFMISQNDIADSKRLWRFFYLSKINRKKQPGVDLWKQIGNNIDLEQPIIVYAGQNDFESGIQPYTDNSKKYHSPIFDSSQSAAIYLYQLCKKKGWNFIYKLHPIMIQNQKEFINLPNDMVILKSADINDVVDIADIVVTILSTTAYVSLIRNKPTVMLGYTQLKGKNCTYEAFEKEMIESQMETALNNGFTFEQKEAFLKHMAFMNTYYLFRNFNDNENIIKYGKEIETFKLNEIL